MLQRVDRHAAAATKHRLPRRVPRLALGSIAAVAVVIGLVVALGPGGSGDDDASHGVPAFVGPDTAAARELVRAGDAAADAPWGPLGDGEYYRLYSTSIPGRSDRASSQPTSYELWMDRDGRGQNLYVMGATDPSRYPMLHGSSIGFNTSPAKHPVSLEE